MKEVTAKAKPLREERAWHVDKEEHRVVIVRI